jgi:hypothetical protein
MTLTDDIKREIRERVDLAHLIGGSVKLAKAGAEFKGLCPFHNEGSPSFHVVPAKQMFHCFGCGKSGDCFDWVMERQHISFPDAAKMLAREVNVTLPEDPAGRFYQPRVHGRTVEPEPEIAGEKDAPPFEAAESASQPTGSPSPRKGLDPERYEPIPEGGRVWRYLTETRGLNEGVIPVYGLKQLKDPEVHRYLSWLYKKGEITAEEGKRLREGGALTFPYHDRRVRKDRKTDEDRVEWRWLFSKILCVERLEKPETDEDTGETRIKRKKVEWRDPSGAPSILFGAQAVPITARRIIICEGEMDALSWRTYGEEAVSVPNGAGSLGWVTACWDWLEQFETVLLSFDEDGAGQRAVKEAVKRLGIDRTGIVRLPEKETTHP